MTGAMKVAAVFVVLAVAVACTNDNTAVTSTDLLIDLTPTQVAQECRFLASELPQKQVTCNGNTMTIGIDAPTCDTESGNLPLTCTATVGEYQACASAEYANPCGSNGTATDKACQPVTGCGTGL